MALRTALISADELRRTLSSVRVVDCSHDLSDPYIGPATYAVAHIPGAVHAHLDDVLSGPKVPGVGRHPLPVAREFTDWLGHQGIAPHETVVAYDRSGGAYAARLWWLLRWIGHKDVRVLDGGWRSWEALGGEISCDAPSYPSAAYPASDGESAMWVDVAFVEENLRAKTSLVVDARGPDRYAGIIEPIDARAGHIPGAVNRPYTANLTPEGRFKIAEDLREQWDFILGYMDGRDVVAQCGSGVTACHNLLALEIAGIHGARLYPGSWSEWSSDRARPIAVGDK